MSFLKVTVHVRFQRLINCFHLLSCAYSAVCFFFSYLGLNYLKFNGAHIYFVSVLSQDNDSVFTLSKDVSLSQDKKKQLLLLCLDYNLKNKIGTISHSHKKTLLLC